MSGYLRTKLGPLHLLLCEAVLLQEFRTVGVGDEIECQDIDWK